jgi:hypothetical protein
VFDGVLVEVDGLHIDRGLSQWVSLNFNDLSLFPSSGLWLTTSTDLVVPFLETSVLFHRLSVVFLSELAAITFLILSEVALEFLALTVIGTCFAVGVDEGETVVLLLVLVILDGVVPSRELGAELVVAFH